jgi:NitT/TauT family transport system ATP-binding protein
MYKVEGLSKSYRDLHVLDDFSLEFPEGKITAILGPSGCGKTTLLNILAGLVRADRGRVCSAPRVSYLFQEPRLLPWLTVRNNLALVLRDKIAPSELNERIERYLRATGIEAYQLFYPAQLSGGLRQRAALARAFSYSAPLLLMDEPFKSLDVKTRFRLIADFMRLWEEEPRTVITVTHDIREAALLGDKIVVLSDKPAAVIGTINQTKEREGERLFKVEQELLEMMLR